MENEIKDGTGEERLVYPFWNNTDILNVTFLSAVGILMAIGVVVIRY